MEQREYMQLRVAVLSCSAKIEYNHATFSVGYYELSFFFSFFTVQRVNLYYSMRKYIALSGQPVMLKAAVVIQFL
jgi:hypothetical protein